MSVPYVTRHGFGYSVFEHSECGIHSDLSVYVAIDAPVKFAVLKVRNESGRPRRLSVTGYLEWVFGSDRQKTAMHVCTGIDPGSGALFARNPYNTEFAGRTGVLRCRRDRSSELVRRSSRVSGALRHAGKSGRNVADAALRLRGCGA